MEKKSSNLNSILSIKIIFLKTYFHTSLDEHDVIKKTLKVTNRFFRKHNKLLGYAEDTHKRTTG